MFEWVNTNIKCAVVCCFSYNSAVAELSVVLKRRPLLCAQFARCISLFVELTLKHNKDSHRLMCMWMCQMRQQCDFNLHEINKFYVHIFCLVNHKSVYTVPISMQWLKMGNNGARQRFYCKAKMNTHVYLVCSCSVFFFFFWFMIREPFKHYY